MNTKILCAGTFSLLVASMGMRWVDSINAPVYFIGSFVLGTIWLAVKYK